METSAVDYRCGAHTVHIAERRVSYHGQPVELEAKVFDLIALLLENRQRTLGKEEIVTALWGTRPVTDAALSQLVYKARRVFHDDGEHQAVIRTVYGHGLQWVAPVEVLLPAEAETGNTSTVAPGVAVVRPRSRMGVVWTGVVVLALATVLSLALVVNHNRASPAPALPRVALLPIDNATGDSAEDWTSHGLPGLMGSLLGSARGIDVVDPIQVARVWNFTVPTGGDRIQHTRKITGAAILVTGRLRKLGRMYELSLHVDRGSGDGGEDITLTGAEPGQLAVAALPRIRHALRLDPPDTPTLAVAPGDPYLAQTFARGMNAGMHGRWSDARPYFVLCAKQAPDFLPCRLRLGQAQANTDQLADAKQTLLVLLATARQRGATDMVAKTLLHLAGVALIRHAHATALQRLQEAAPLARQLMDSGLQVDIALKTVNVAARLKRFKLADRELERARDLVERKGLESNKSDLYNSEAFLAEARGDYTAAERADRAALAASDTVGNQANAVGDAYNLGLALMHHRQVAEALPLLAYTFRQGGKLQNPRLEFAGGDNLAIALLDAGVTAPVPAIDKRLLEIGKQQHHAVWQALAWILRGGRQWYDGDHDGALASARKSVALVDPGQDPALWVALQLNAASAALFEDPASLHELFGQVDALVAKQPRPSDYASTRQLVRAMAAAAAGDHAAAHAALRKAAASMPHRDTERSDLQRAGLAIALASHDAEAARIALKNFNARRCHMADVLQLAEQWARRQGDTRMAHAIGQRLALLRKTALQALHQTGITIPPAS